MSEQWNMWWTVDMATEENNFKNICEFGPLVLKTEVQYFTLLFALSSPDPVAKELNRWADLGFATQRGLGFFPKSGSLANKNNRYLTFPGWENAWGRSFFWLKVKNSNTFQSPNLVGTGPLMLLRYKSWKITGSSNHMKHFSRFILINKFGHFSFPLMFSLLQIFALNFWYNQILFSDVFYNLLSLCKSTNFIYSCEHSFNFHRFILRT